MMVIYVVAVVGKRREGERERGREGERERGGGGTF